MATKAWHAEARKLAAEADADPRTAAKFLNGEPIRTRTVLQRLKEAAEKLGLTPSQAEQGAA
jgi:DNA-binding LacI/PurR family transcriptional regulator